ncbi:hypothetical protein ACH5RR_019897 [Cinchona calisaya]|uniref:PWWP domain-containing protein n=1 Tax=Cinchona calisaya TaxID=153742 RepID=A0ABD2ZVY9_9GENT
MSSSETGGADCSSSSSIGSIVWVRRRNGSWWPGKILGPDDLSASHAMSPRSGTPVKLLGREDASVDWYNLEKSKRVKAFRCGEFDECIERAEASQGLPPKKREKYARREDAILHALELERQMLEKKCGKASCSTNGETPYGMNKESVTSTEKLEIVKGKYLQPETNQVCQSLSLRDKREDQDICLESVTDENQLCVDDGKSGVPPRMRGLQDLGLRAVPSNLKTSPSFSPNGSHKPLFDTSAPTHPNDDALSSEDVVNANFENSSDKRKRLHEGLDQDSLAKRRERHRPLLQVLENSTKIIVPHSQADGSINVTSMSEDEKLGGTFPVTRNRYPCMQPAYLYEEDNMGSAEDTETDSSETDSMDSDTDELASLSEGAASIELQPKYPRRSEVQAESISISSEELDDLALGDETSHPGNNHPPSAGMSMSRWQLKGKRSLLKRPVDGADRNLSWGSIDETTAFDMENNGRDETYLVEKNFTPQMAGYGSRGPDGISRRTMQWQHWDWNDQPAAKRYWEGPSKYFDPVFVGHHRVGGRSMLVDVDLKVQSSYQRQHVPIISLMSKFNGHAIIGHPIQIEALENGSTESLVAETDEWCPEILENETALAPTWRTARRTAKFRVPRPDLYSTCDESANHHLQFDDGRRGGCSGKSDAGTFGHKEGVMEKHTNNVPVDRKSSRKPLKKISLSSSNQKIRTLSSIASQQQQSNDPRQRSSSFGLLDGLKSEYVSTAVACIPVKLVFSRLQEELVGRHT